MIPKRPILHSEYYFYFLHFDSTFPKSESLNAGLLLETEYCGIASFTPLSTSSWLTRISLGAAGQTYLYRQTEEAFPKNQKPRFCVASKQIAGRGGEKKKTTKN